MPRLAPFLLRRAHNISPHLATLLPVCRDLGSAQNELRWICEHAQARHGADSNGGDGGGGGGSRSRTALGAEAEAGVRARESLIEHLCRRRGRGVPLQYVLGSQPFGTLDIKCRPGVLIPRPETEAWVLYLVDIVRKTGLARDGRVHGGGDGDERLPPPLRVVDLCSGTGCIPLLLYSLLRRRFPQLTVRGVDVESRAVALARENLASNTERGLLPRSTAGQGVAFEKADIFSNDWISFLRHNSDDGEPEVDILVSNPPYISAEGFNRDTDRSVRNFEPRLALVPDRSLTPTMTDCAPEDVFYARLLEIAGMLCPKIVVFEVGDLAQALRVVQMAMRQRLRWERIEVWRDWPDMAPEDNEAETVEVGDLVVPVRGSGNGRAVYLRRLV